MSKSRAITENFTRMVNSERWKTLSVEQQSKYKQEYDEMLDRALAEEQQTATPTTADTGSATEAQPPKSRQIAQNFNRMRETDRWKTGLTDEQRENYTEEAKALHRRALVEEGSDQTPDTKLNVQQEVWQPYMPPEEEKRMADPTVGTVGKALGKSLLRAPGNLASTIVGAGGVIADLAGKGLKNIPYLEGVGSKISEVGQDTINVSNTMDAWNKHYIPPEQTAPQNLQEFGDMTWGQKGVFLADQLPEQVATMFLPGMMGAKFGQAAVAGAKGAKAAGVLKPLTGYLTSKGPKAAQALGALTGSTIQSAAEIGKSQMQEAGDTDALATMIAAPLAGKLESLVPASAEWLSGSFKGASRKAFSEAMKSPVTFLAHVSKEMLKNSTTESVTELMQESIQKYATERAKGERGQGVLDAAAKASNILREKGIDGLIAEAKKNETVGQLAMAAILGGVAGGVFEGTGRSFAGAKYLTSPVLRYDAMVNAQTDEEKKVAAESWNKLTPLQMQKAREEAAFRTIFELDDDESDPETVKDNFNVLRELGADGYAVAAQSAAANGWTPSESYQTRMTEFLTENPEFATELEKISGAQAAKTAPKVTQEKPYVNLDPKSNISGQNAPAKPQPNVVDLINQIAGGQGDEYDSYAQSLANAQEPDPETKRASAVGGDLETAPGIINAKDYQESPDELTRLFPPEDMFSTGKTEQGEVAAREIPGKGFAGKKTKIRAGDITTDGEYAIVELDSLQRNKQMGELQNRDRTREASQAQIESIAANPDPDMLISSDVFANDGPMVVGPDFVVESGNGRTEGLNLAYQKGSAGKYTQALVQRAAEFGLDPQAISRMKKPVLVRIRTGEVAGNDRSAFVSAANAPRQLQRSATEKAITDGQAILDFVGNLETTGSNINTAANRPFLAEFFNRVATPEERGALFTATGELSQDGLNRVRNAVFSAAYGSPDLLVNLTEDTDSEIKSIINGLLEAAPDTAALSGEAKRGGVHPVSLTSALADAAKKIAGLRQQGQKVEAYFQQGQFGDDKLSPEARMLLGLFSDLGSSKKINDFVRAFNQTVRAYGSPSQMQIPGMETEPPTIREVMTQAIRKTTPELESKIDRWVQGPPSLGVEFSRKGQKSADAGNQKLLDLLEQIGQNADPETAQASNKLVNLINSIGDKTPEQTVENKPADETGQGQVKYFSQPKEPGAQAGVISREELENTARTIQANLEPTTGVKVVVLETTDELAKIVKGNVPTDVEGALFNNTAYLVRNNLPDAKRATEVAGHEIIGHFGLQAILGREFTSQLVELEKLAETDQQVKAELDRAEKDYFNEKKSNIENRRIALEEALARISEKYAADPDTFGGKVRAWFEQSIGKIRDALRVLGFDMKFDARDLANTIRSSKAAVTRDGSFNKKPRLSTMAEVAAVDEKYRRAGPEAEQAWNYAKKNAHKILFSYGRAEDFPFFKYLSPETQTAIRKDLEAHARGNKARIEEARKNARTETPIRSLLEFEHSTVEWAPFMFMGKSASIDAFGAAKSIVKNDPDIKAFRAQIDIKNQKFLNDFMGGDEDDADKVFLKKFAELFKEAIDGVSNNNVLIKKGGDDWDAMVVTGKDITEDDFRYHLENAHRKAILHAIEQKVAKDVANARAEEPNILGESLALNYELAPDDPRLIKLTKNYASKLWKYLTARGIGFRIGVVDATNLDFDQTNKILVDQHHREKTGEALDAKSAAALRRDFQKSVSLIQRGIAPIRSRLEGKILASADGGTEEQALKRSRAKSQWGISPVDLEHEEVLPNRLEEQPQPSKLERLISQIGEELPPQHKETGNKLLDILSSLGDDTASDDPQFSIKTGSLGKPGFQPMHPVMSGDENFNRAYGIEPGRGHVYDDVNSDEPTVINRTGSSWRARFQNPGAAAWVRQEELKENARFREEQRQGYEKTRAAAEFQLQKDLTGDPRFSRKNGKVEERQSAQQLTLDFFSAAPEVAGPAAEQPVEPPTPVLEKFFQVTENVRLGSFRHNVEKITGPKDVASILSPIANKGREIFYTLVVDKESKPIAAIKVSTGARDTTAVPPLETLGGIASLPNAAAFYIAHNHPSGSIDFSNADRAVAKKLSSATTGTGIEYMGSLVLSGERFKFSDKEGWDTEPDFFASEDGRETQILGEPEIKTRSEESFLSHGKQVYDYLKDSDVLSKSGSGVILVDNRNRVLAEVAMPSSEMLGLRTNNTSTGAVRLLSAADKSNATGIIAVIPKPDEGDYLSTSKAVADIFKNLTRFGDAVGLRPLDVIAHSDVGYYSAREYGVEDGIGPYFSRKTDPEKQPAKTQLEKLLEALPEKDISKKAKSKLEETLEALPDESPKYSYAGQRAKRPKNVRTWEEAKARLDAGEDPEAVRLETGWFVSPYDKKPRFEIDDSKVELNEQLRQHPATNGRTVFELGGIMNHPELFAAYPALKDIMTTIVIDPNKQESGSYLPGTPGDEYTYGREPEIRIVAPDSESAKNSLIHEIQHAIQETEGFAKGGSPREFLQAEKDKLDMIMERISILNEEMEDAVGTPRYKELMSARNELSQQAVEIQKIWDAQGGAYGAAFNKYQSLAGEIEARDSADRTELSQEERRLYPPYSTAEYGPDEAIVRFSRKGNPQTETPEFKNWFGDWESNSKAQKIKKLLPQVLNGNEFYSFDNAFNIKDAKKKAIEWASQNGIFREVENAESKDNIIISRRGLIDALNHASGKQKIQIIPALPQIIESAIPVTEHPNAKNKTLIDKIYAGKATINNEELIVGIVTHEDANGNRFYDHELTTIEKLNAASNIGQSRTDGVGVGRSAPHRASVNNVIENLWSVNPDFTSKVIDADGRPLVMYHGTGETFTAFDSQKVGSNFGFDKEGFFFTNSPDKANRYASEAPHLMADSPKNPNIMPVYLNIKNPLTLDDYLWATSSNRAAEIDNYGSVTDYFDVYRKDIMQYAKDNRNDGILFEDKGDILAVAFEPTQIKSAIGNSGTFDPENPDIRFSKQSSNLADKLDPNPEPPPTLTEESKSQASKVYKAIHQIASGLMGKTVSQRDLEDPAFKRSQSFDPEAETDFEIGRKHKISAGVKSKDSEDKTILSHLDADKNLITGMIRKLTPKGDLQDWLLKKAARVLAPYQAAKPIERILFTVGENIAWDGKKIVASPGIRSYNPETGEYEYKPSEHAAAAMHFFNMLSPEWQELMTERAKANEEYRQNFVNVVIPHRKAQTAIALLARYRQMGADRTALEGAEAEARSMLKALDGKIDQAEHNELKSLLEEVVSIPADRINKMVVRMESIIKQATGELKTPAQLQRALKSLNTNRGHYGYVHHFFESDRVPSQGKAFDAFGRVPNGWIEDVPGTQKIRTGAEGNKRNLLEADIAKEAKEAKAEAANNWMRDIEDQRGLLVEEFEDIPDDQMPEGYVGYENERPFRRRVFANFGKYRGQEIYLPVKTFDSYKLVKEKGVDDPSMKEFGETIAMLDGVANRMNEAMLYHTGKFARDLLSAPFHIIEFVRDWSFTSPTEIPFVIKALTKAIASQASAKTWQKSTPESHGEYSESLPYQNKSDKKSFLTRAGDAIGRLITKDLPVGSTVAAMLKEINLSGAADLPLKRIFESVGEQLAEKRGLKGKARERFVYDMINQYAFVTQDLPPWLAWLRGQMPSKESRGAGAIMRLTIPFLGYSSRLAKQMLADPVSKGLLPMAKRLIGKKDADANFLREFSEASRPFFWLFFKSLVASGLGGLLPPEEEGIASDIQGAENLNPLARTHGRILWSQDDDPKGGENWLSVKGLGHLQVADALSDVVAGKSSVSDLSAEFLTIHPAMSWILGSVGVENPYDAKVPKGARAGRMLAQALVPQLTRYGPEMGKFFRAAAGNNTIPDAQKQSFFTAFFEQLGIPAGEVKVDRDGKLRTTRTGLELLKQVGINMRHIPYDMIAEAVDNELGSAKYYTDRLEMIQEYRDGDRDPDLSEREFIAQSMQTNKWTKIDDAERDMTKALVDRGQGALATVAKLRQKGVPVNTKPAKKKKDKGFGGSFGGKKFGGGFGNSFKKSPESKREEKISDLEKTIQEIQSKQPKSKSWYDQLLDVLKSM